MANQSVTQSLDGLVDFTQQFQAGRSNPAKNYTPVVIVSHSSAETTLLETGQQARNIGIPVNHAFCDFGAWKARFSRATQDPKGIVLGSSQVIGLEELVIMPLQLVIGAR